MSCVRTSESEPHTHHTHLLAWWLENPIIAAAEQSAARELFELCQTIELRPGEVVSPAGSRTDRLTVLLSGTVRVSTRTPRDLPTIVRFSRAPGFIGDTELLAKVEAFETTTIDTCWIAVLPRNAYLEFLRSHPSVMMAHMTHLARLATHDAQMQTVAHARIEARIAHLFLQLAELGSETRSDGLRILMPLSQTAIAESLGVVSRSVTIVMGQWQRQQLIAKRGQYFIVLDRARLAQIASTIRCDLTYWIGKVPMLSGEPAESELEIVGGDGQGQRVVVRRETIIGRATWVSLSLRDSSLAAQQCRLSQRGDRLWIHDLGTDSGTFVNDRRVLRSVLRVGDLIQIRGVRLRVRRAAQRTHQTA